jgi:ATP synthase protein I
LGFILPAAVVVGFGIGYALDKWLHTRPVLAIVMAFLGGAGGFIEVLRILIRTQNDAGGNNHDGRPDAG